MAGVVRLPDDGEDSLECAVCLLRYNDPRLLPCYHTFCLRCVTANAGDGVGGFACPTCRTTTPVPHGGPQLFPVNVYMAALVRQSEFTKQPPDCEVCTAKSTNKLLAKTRATHWCLECDRQLCNSCLHVHDVLLADHTTSSLSKASSLTINKKAHCTKHPTEVLRFHCVICFTPVCRDCRLTEHEGHRCKDMADLVPQIKAIVSEVNTLVNGSLIPVMSSKAEICAQVLEDRVQSKETMRRAIKEREEALVAIIQDASKQALKSLDEVCRVFEEDAVKSKSLVACLKSQCNYNRRVLATKCDADILLALQALKTTFQDLAPFNNAVSADQVIMWDKSECLHFGDLKSEDGCFSMDDWKAFTRNYLGRACLRKKKKLRAGNHTSFKPVITECLQKIQTTLAFPVPENSI